MSVIVPFWSFHARSTLYELSPKPTTSPELLIPVAAVKVPPSPGSSPSTVVGRFW
jgi:hypothetical protein